VRWDRTCTMPCDRSKQFVMLMLIQERLEREREVKSRTVTINRLRTQVKTVTKQLQDTKTALDERQCPPAPPPCPEPQECPPCAPRKAPTRWGVNLGYLAAGAALGVGGYFAYRQFR
jgi:hypothetical protein